MFRVFVHHKKCCTLRLPAALAVACALLLAVVAPPAHAAEPVGAAIVKAHKAGKITRGERRTYMRQWRRSGSEMRRLSRRKQRSRALEIANVRRLTTNLARRGKLNADRMPAIMANVNATTYVFTRMRFPQRQARIRIPSDTVVFAYYPGSGVQFQPLFTFTHANRLYNQRKDAELERLAQRMLQLSVTRGSFTTWEYYFPYGGGDFPWVSGMAQGVSLQVLARTTARTGDKRYLRTAEKVLDGFTRTSSQQGFVSYEPGGRWYLLYGFNSRQRVLNGHLQALIGLHAYHKATGSERARVYRDQGIGAVLPLLRKFDTGAWSNYVPGQEADIGYHDLMTSQLQRLAKQTGNQTFADYAHRFATYRVTPPRISVSGTSFPTMYPHARDGFRDAARIRYFVDKRAKLVLTVRNRAGTNVRRMRNATRRGWYNLSWDMRTTTGRTVPPGVYTVHLAATDILGNRRSGQLTQAIVVERDKDRPVVRSARVRRAAAKRTVVVARVHDAHSGWVEVKVVGASGTVMARARTRARGSARLKIARPHAAVRRGRIVVTDSSGNRVSKPLQ